MVRAAVRSIGVSPRTLADVIDALHAPALSPEALPIAFDATPIADTDPRAGHGLRGVGRATAAMLQALALEEPAWTAAHLGIVIAHGRPSPTVPYGTRR